MCEQCACLSAFCMDRVLAPRQFVGLFGTTKPEMQVETAFVREFGRLYPRTSGGGFRGGQCCTCNKGVSQSLKNSGNAIGPIISSDSCLSSIIDCRTKPRTAEYHHCLFRKEGPTAPPLLSQTRALQFRLPRILSGQGPSGILRVGRRESRATGLASVSRTHLSKLCEHLTQGEQYRCKDMSFRLQAVAEN